MNTKITLSETSANQKADAHYYMYTLRGRAKNNSHRNGINKGIHFLLKAEQFLRTFFYIGL